MGKKIRKYYFYITRGILLTASVLVLGELYYYSTNLDKAIFYFQKIISVNKNNLWAYYWLGLTFDKAKNYKKAILYYKEFLEKVTEKDYKQKIIIEKRLKMLKS